MNDRHLHGLRSRAQAGIAKRIYSDAAESQQQLRAFGDEIVGACECRAIYGTVKGRERAEEKVAGRLGGDWFELRDAVRMTIVAANSSVVRQVQTEIRARAVAHRGLGIIRDFELSPDKSPCGYSGVNFAVRLQNGRPGEIQVNIPEVMYGQFKEAVFCQALSDAEYNRIRREKGLDGGLGHVFYEIFRVAPASAKGKAAADLSRRYFQCLRGKSSLALSQQLASEIAAFMQA